MRLQWKRASSLSNDGSPQFLITPESLRRGSTTARGINSIEDPVWQFQPVKIMNVCTKLLRLGGQADFRDVQLLNDVEHADHVLVLRFV